MIKILLLIFAILALSAQGFRVRNKLEDHRLEVADGNRLELGQNCWWDPVIEELVCV